MAGRKPSLRSVGADEAPETPPTPPRRKSITEAADAGSQLELLVAMRSRIAKSVEDPNCPPRDLAALTRRLQDIGRDIEALEAKARQEEAESGHAADEEWDAAAF